MAILLGVDEAGFGPLIGPLCVAAAVFEASSARPYALDDAVGRATSGSRVASAVADDPFDLWSRLDAAVCRAPRDRRNRIAIADSKKLKRPNSSASHPLEHLERGVLAALACVHEGATGGDAKPVNDLSLLRALGAPPPDSPPWSGATVPLPLANDASLLGIASARLGRALESAQVRLLRLRVIALDAPSFNRALDRVRSKAAINTSLSFEHLLDAARRHPGEEIFASFDRHGGRTHYREELAFTFPQARLRVLEESDECSRYELLEGGRRLAVSWEVEAESKRLPVALASMSAKLARELWMARLNRYFARFLPDLKPTAGYVEDGRRWLAEVKPHLSRIGVAEDRLVRRA